MSIGQNLSRLRKAQDLTQTELAKRVNVDQSMICQIERGTKTLSLPLALEIADTLRCSVLDLARNA